jgi:hypothetical protein
MDFGALPGSFRANRLSGRGLRRAKIFEVFLPTCRRGLSLVFPKFLCGNPLRAKFTQSP